MATDKVEGAQPEPSKVELSEAEVESLREAGLERREGVPGLHLLRVRIDGPIVPWLEFGLGIELEGELKTKVEAIRDELVRHLRKKGTAGLPRISEGADLKGAWLAGANLYKAKLQEANLVWAQLQGSHLGGAQLQGAHLKRAQLQGARLNVAQLQGANLNEAELQGANLERAELQGGNLQNAQLQGARLPLAQLQGADLKRAQLQGASLLNAQLQGANLCGANLTERVLENGTKKKTDLSQANLQEAKLLEAQMQGANLEQADLHRADLSEAQLHRANFTQANLKEANMTGAELPGADFTSANLTGANLKGALESLTNYKPPRPPAALARRAWRTKAVGAAASKGAYKLVLSQGDDDDDNDDDDDDDDEGSGSEDDDDDTVTPWQDEAMSRAVSQMVESLVTVAQPVLELVESTIAELERLCDALSEGLPLWPSCVCCRGRSRPTRSSPPLRSNCKACWPIASSSRSSTLPCRGWCRRCRSSSST